MLIRKLFALTLFIAVSSYIHAQELRLEVRSHADSVNFYDADELEALGIHRIKTETPWFEEEMEFSGPLLRDVLQKAGFDHDSIKAAALNDYSVTIPASDAQDYDVIIATRINGERLAVRDRGPFWVIYPYSEKNLTDQIYLTRSVWQLNLLENGS